VTSRGSATGNFSTYRARNLHRPQAGQLRADRRARAVDRDRDGPPVRAASVSEPLGDGPPPRAALRVEPVLVLIEHLLPRRPLLAAREVRAHVRELLDDAEPAHSTRRSRVSPTTRSGTQACVDKSPYLGESGYIDQGT